MRWRAQCVAHSRNLVESVVALLAVLGTTTAEVPATETLITGGLRAWRPANVSSKLVACRYLLTQTENTLIVGCATDFLLSP